MSVQNHNWLNLHSTRKYPLDDTATGIDDEGKRLKSDIIVDLCLRWPEEAGQFVFLSGLTVSERLVSVVFLAAETVDSIAAFTPIASITLPKPLDPSRYYPLSPIYPGSAGYIAFGDVSEAFFARFSTPQQGLLAPRVAQPYRPLPIPEFRKIGLAEGLSGVVSLVAGTDLEISQQTVEIEGITREAIVFQLPAATSAKNAMASYIGACDTRPESGNCAVPGIATLGGVTPDCDGNLEIEFLNFVAAPYPCGSEAAGITLDQVMGLSDVCGDTRPVPYQGEDWCAPADSASSLSSESLPSESLPSESSSESLPSEDSDSSEAVPCEELPFTDCFAPAAHADWDTKLGSFQITELDQPPGDCLEACDGSSTSSESLATCSGGIYQAHDPSRRNLAIWENCAGESSHNKRVAVYARLTGGSFLQNAGAVLNYQLADPLSNPHIEYFVVEINRNDNKIYLLRFNGGSLVREHSATPASPIRLRHWYKISTAAQPLGGNTLLQVSVTSPTDESWIDLNFSVLTSRWGDPIGHFGIHSTQSVAEFTEWSLEDV